MSKALLLLVVVAIIQFPAHGQSHSWLSVNSVDAYTFPVSPDSPQWKELKTRQQRLEACALPREVLETISTRGLLQTCLDFPFAPDMAFHGTLKRGLDRVVTDFNGLRELLRRKDAAAELARSYGLLTLPPDGPLAEQGRYALYVRYHEMLLSRPEVQSRLTPATSAELLASALAKLDTKHGDPEVFGGRSIIATAYLLATILDHVGGEEFDSNIAHNESLRKFLQSSQTDDDTVIDLVSALARDFQENRGQGR